MSKMNYNKLSIGDESVRIFAKDVVSNISPKVLSTYGENDIDIACSYLKRKLYTLQEKYIGSKAFEWLRTFMVMNDLMPSIRVIKSPTKVKCDSRLLEINRVSGEVHEGGILKLINKDCYESNMGEEDIISLFIGYIEYVEYVFKHIYIRNNELSTDVVEFKDVLHNCEQQGILPRYVYRFLEYAYDYKSMLILEKYGVSVYIKYYMDEDCEERSDANSIMYVLEDAENAINEIRIFIDSLCDVE